MATITVQIRRIDEEIWRYIRSQAVLNGRSSGEELAEWVHWRRQHETLAAPGEAVTNGSERSGERRAS